MLNCRITQHPQRCATLRKHAQNFILEYKSAALPAELCRHILVLKDLREIARKVLDFATCFATQLSRNEHAGAKFGLAKNKNATSHSVPP